MSSFQCRELLTKGQILNKEATMGAEEQKKREIAVLLSDTKSN
jgi:hypothetical protein